MQCSIPVIELLLPEPHNTLLLDLLFILCTWHASAKLRLHTSTTLRYLKEATRSLGFILRKFAKKTCSAFDTHELPREVNARTRRKAASLAKGRGLKGKKTVKWGKGKGKQQDSTPRQRKLFNLCTYKLSALGEYTRAILQYGTTESYSTQTVCIHSNLFVLKTDWIERVNSNTDALSGFMPGQTRQKLLLPRSQNIFVASVSLGKLPNVLELIVRRSTTPYPAP
jgi:hypothetical protein